ncbi:MAG: hypothetical protein U0821_16090 [Chloroflexota bacterium]
MDLSAVRAWCLAQPETVESPHFALTSFRVNGKIVATAPPCGGEVRIFVGELEARAVSDSFPNACEVLWWGRRVVGVRVWLAHADEGLVFELLESSWGRRAPKRLLVGRA